MMDALQTDENRPCIEDIVLCGPATVSRPMENIPTYSRFKKRPARERESVHRRLTTSWRKPKDHSLTKNRLCRSRRRVMRATGLAALTVCAAAMVKKIAEEMPRNAPAFEKKARWPTASKKKAFGSFRPVGKIRQLRVSTNPRCGLCGGQLSDGPWPQGEPPRN